MAKVSVLMAVHNTPSNFLNQSINSIINQSFRDLEFIIINDASNEITSSLLYKWARLDSRITIKNLNLNVGLTKALNIGLDLAGAKYIARQDSDDISCKSRLEDQIVFLEENQEIDAVCSDAILINENSNEVGFIKINSNANELLRKNTLVHGAMLFRRNVFDVLEGYDERMYLSQDYELYLRMIHQGKMNIGVISKPHYYLRKHSKSLSSRHLLRQLYFAAIAKELSRTSQISIPRRIKIWFIFMADLFLIHYLFLGKLKRLLN